MKSNGRPSAQTKGRWLQGMFTGNVIRSIYTGIVGQEFVLAQSFQDRDELRNNRRCRITRLRKKWVN